MTAAPSPVRSAAPIGVALLLALTMGRTMAGVVLALAALGTAAESFGAAALLTGVVANGAFYDGERTAVRFTARLRDQVELEAVSDDLRATVARSVSPAGTGLWLRRPDAGVAR